jgi:uncharacterized repeat protein (TIGR01451 family)
MGERRTVSLERIGIAHRLFAYRSSVSRAMIMNLTLLALALPLTLGNNPVPVMQPPGPAPFLHVKVIPPKDTRVTWYPMNPNAVTFAEPTNVGLRPGYRYRPELNFTSEGKEIKLYPSIEVRGTLQPPKFMDVSKHPVPLVFSEDDIALALRGRLVTKYVLLESPDKADAIQTVPDQLLEYPYPTEREALKDAREKGRLVLIVRLGERDYTREELIEENIPGTILFPGAKAIPTPSYPPYIPFGGVLLYDPILGPKLSDDECLADGGDTKKIIGIGPKEKVTGLDPSDTAIEFTTPKGKKVIPSNRVCLCVPRFIALRVEVMLAENTLTQIAQARHQTNLTMRVKNRLFAFDAYRVDGMLGVQSRYRPNGLIGTFGVAAVDQFSGKPMAVAVQNGTKIVADVRELEELNATDCKMMLTKWVEPQFPEKIGEEVTFFLKYHNGTNTTISDVVISDSLTARLEYIPDSTKSDRGCTFTTEPNEAGSVILKWALDGKLKPGEGGLIKFKARIR